MYACVCVCVCRESSTLTHVLLSSLCVCVKEKGLPPKDYIHALTLCIRVIYERKIQAPCLIFCFVFFYFVCVCVCLVFDLLIDYLLDDLPQSALTKSSYQTQLCLRAGWGRGEGQREREREKKKKKKKKKKK
jgi:hypothetical protein